MRHCEQRERFKEKGNEKDIFPYDPKETIVISSINNEEYKLGEFAIDKAH